MRRKFLKYYRTKLKSKKAKIILAILMVLMVLSNLYFINFNFMTFKVEYHYASENNKKKFAPLKNYKIGYFVYYNALGDTEAIKQKCIAGQNIGWDCYIFYYPFEAGSYWFYSKYLKIVTGIINFLFKPDFLIHAFPSKFSISNESIPNYLLITYDVSKFIENKSWVWSNINSYDGYISYTTSHGWLKDESLLTYALPTVATQPYKQIDFNKIFYCGDNWDSLRSSNHYRNIFQNLIHKNLIEVYGPSKSWSYLKVGYKGYLPHDGKALMKKMQELGIVLILHSEQHLDTATATSRIFEAAAASTLIISDNHPFVKKEFGNCVLYIEPNLPVEKVVKQIEDYIAWAKRNPLKARKKAKCAHDIFSEKFTLEKNLLGLIEFHTQTVSHKK